MSFITGMVDFSLIQWFAQRAKAAYLDEASIRKSFPSTVCVRLIPDIDVQFFLEVMPEQKLQVVSVRGTANLVNAREDAEYIPKMDRAEDVYIHEGFDNDANVVLSHVATLLNVDYTTRFTGHSLGAAIACLLMVKLRKQGILIDRSINFGQPKVTNAAGAKEFGNLPLTRVVDENDVVPRLPPLTLLDSLHGFYEHFGDEVLLLSGPNYAYEPESVADSQTVTDFWRNLLDESITEHYMDNYLANIAGKLANPIQVAYADRSRYLA